MHQHLHHLATHSPQKLQTCPLQRTVKHHPVQHLLPEKYSILAPLALQSLKVSLRRLRLPTSETHSLHPSPVLPVTVPVIVPLTLTMTVPVTALRPVLVLLMHYYI